MCGIFGVYGKDFEAARLIHPGLWALQHRGQESSGIAASDGKTIKTHCGVGLVASVYSEEKIQYLKGYLAIGHNRYATSGDTGPTHCQPIVKTIKKGYSISLVHNGNLPSVKKITKFLAENNIDSSGLNDSELITEAITVYLKDNFSLEEAIKKAYPLLTGVFCLLIMDQTKIIAVRDKFGIRPLSIGKLNGGYIFASETCALDIIGARFLRDVKPGEMVVVREDGLKSYQLVQGVQKLDIFEFVYFARPDSILLGKSVDRVRNNFGVQLALEHQISADLVVPVPDSAIPAALGYSRQSGIPYYPALIKNRYIHRTFISPEEHTRGKIVQLKLNPMKHVLKNKRVIVVDDSLVRGTTSKEIISLIRKAGAKKVHLLISSPPVKFPDFYGINTPNQVDLMAANMTLPQMKQKLGVDSLSFLSFNGMIKATGLPQSKFCTSCFSGKYPVDLGERLEEIEYLPKKHSHTHHPRMGTLAL